jgi:hypothetical protein
MQNLNLFSLYTDLLNKNKIDYFVTGSVASIVYGEPRLTHDIDLVLNLLEDHVDLFMAAFPADQFYCPPKEVIKVELRRNLRGHLNLIHHETGFKADIYFVEKEELQIWAFKNRQTIKIYNSTISLAPPEYVIVKKLEFYEEGKDQKHLNDINGILSNSRDIINFKFLNKIILEKGLDKLWQSLSEERSDI